LVLKVFGLPEQAAEKLINGVKGLKGRGFQPCRESFGTEWRGWKPRPFKPLTPIYRFSAPSNRAERYLLTTNGTAISRAPSKL
jgi:hypothetical protein